MVKGYRFAIIAGTGLSGLFQRSRGLAVKTLYGRFEAFEIDCAGYPSVFLPRHGIKYTIPPHKINYRANIWGLKELGVKDVLAVTSVGSMNETMKPGDFVATNQFIDLTKRRVCTFYDGSTGVVHTDVSEPYSSKIRRAFVEAGKRLKIRVHGGGVYVCMEGPRFETPAEIRMLKIIGGDLVGMTGIPEVVLANEVSMNYGNLSVVTNWAAGMQSRISHKETVRRMERSNKSVKRLLEESIRLLSEKD